MSWFSNLFNSAPRSATVELNPASSLPMVQDSGIDIAGNTYGTTHDDASWSGFSDDVSGGFDFSGFDD